MWPFSSRAAKTLVGIDAPTRVAVRGRIVTSNNTHSPAGGVACALARWELVAAQTLTSNGSEGGGTKYTLLRAGLIGEPVLIRSDAGPTIRVPLEGLLFLANVAEDEVLPLPADLDPEFRQMLSTASMSHGAFFFREAFLRHGDVVRLRGYVSRVASGDGYRSAPRMSDFEARADLGELTITDLTFALD